MQETKKGGPFFDILENDIFVNCIYLSTPIPPFLTADMLKKDMKLSVLVDVSCDPTNPHNPLPIYHECTTFDKPTIQVGSLDVIAIDHLPSLLPREASERFCKDLYPTLLELKDRKASRCWQAAFELFVTRSNEAKSNHQ
jgi:saccharopine dehydrogenase (NAD+, L-lysine-forming)